jgi:hypothetical protein
MEKIKQSFIEIMLSFNELKEVYKKSWIGRYTINWIVGLLIIISIIFILLSIGCFITWNIPETIFADSISSIDMMLFRFLLIIYSFLILFITSTIDDSDY